MPFSHHSHSGQFCAHAANTLEEVVQTAIAKGFDMIALTEHIYRGKEDLYPEEAEEHTEASLKAVFEDYMTEAARLKDAYAPQINIMVGFEAEWIRPETEQHVRDVLRTYSGSLDLFLGSVHHVLTYPIDFDRELYEKARDAAGGTDEMLFVKYFDEMYDMLLALQPPVVAHFDLIRLKSDTPNTQFSGLDEVWARMRRNLEFIHSYGGILEVNSAALRKDLAEPYPCLSICQYFASIGGRFTISDDSHGVSQVGTNYARLLEFLQKAGIKEVWHAGDGGAVVKDNRFRAGFSSTSIAELGQHPFWATA